MDRFETAAAAVDIVFQTSVLARLSLSFLPLRFSPWSFFPGLAYSSVNSLDSVRSHSRICGWPGFVQGHSQTQAIRRWPGPFTDNPPYEKSTSYKTACLHNKDCILDSIILLIRISYPPVYKIHEFSLDLKKHTVPYMHLAAWFRRYACV